MDRIRGPYPGGPRRPSEADGEEQVHLESVEEFETRRQEGGVHRKRERRRRRLLLGFVAVLIVAGGLGAFLGIRAHRSPEEIARDEEEARRAQRSPLEEERRKILQELWKMEALEQVPQAPPPRR